MIIKGCKIIYISFTERIYQKDSGQERHENHLKYFKSKPSVNVDLRLKLFVTPPWISIALFEFFLSLSPYIIRINFFNVNALRNSFTMTLWRPRFPPRAISATFP